METDAGRQRSAVQEKPKEEPPGEHSVQLVNPDGELVSLHVINVSGDLIEGQEVELMPRLAPIERVPKRSSHLSRLTMAGIRTQMRGELHPSDRLFMSENNLTPEYIEDLYNIQGSLEDTAAELGLNDINRLTRIMNTFGIDHSLAHGNEVKRRRARQLQEEKERAKIKR